MISDNRNSPPFVPTALGMAVAPPPDALTTMTVLVAGTVLVIADDKELILPVEVFTALLLIDRDPSADLLIAGKTLIIGTPPARLTPDIRVFVPSAPTVSIFLSSPLLSYNN